MVNPGVESVVATPVVSGTRKRLALNNGFGGVNGTYRASGLELLEGVRHDGQRESG